MEVWCVQLKLSAAASSMREKLPTYAPVSTSDTNGSSAVNGRYNGYGEQSVTRASPRNTSLKDSDS
jgi:hypothetical protein